MNAQTDRGELRLMVTDATGLPLRASGTLTSEAPRLSRTFMTSDEGAFSLDALPFGIYRLVVEGSGFRPHAEVVEIRSQVPKSLHIQLALAAVSSQIEVTVPAPLVDPNRTGVSYAISARQIGDTVTAVPGRRLLDVVDQQPGWLMEANGVLHPRGSEYQTLFVVDGVPMDENRSPAFAPDLEEGGVAAVSVLTGNFPAEYGRKLGGVVELTTLKDIEPGVHGSADFTAGSFGTAAASASAAYGWTRRTLSLAGSAARTDRYLDPPVVENFTNHGTLSGVTAGYQDHVSDADRLRASWHHRETDFLVPNEYRQELAGQRQQRTGREDGVQLGWTRVLASRAVLNATVAAQRLSATLESNPESTPIAAAQDRGFTRGYLNGSLAIDARRHQIKLGGDMVSATVHERLDYEITDESAFDADTPLLFRFSDAGRDREQSLFVQDSVRLQQFTISAGLRWDRYNLVVHDTALSPRLGIAWAAPSRQLVLRASFDRVFQTPAVENLLLASSPAVDQLNAVTLRLPVRPSRGNFLEGGVTAGLASTARLDITVYRRTFSNFADDDVFLNTGISFPIAFRSAYVRGLDAKVTLPRWKKLGGFATYALLKGTATLPVVGGLLLGEEALSAIGATDTVPITQEQRHTARAQVRYEGGARWWLAGGVRYGSGLPVELSAEADPSALVGEYAAATLARVDFRAGRVRPNVSLETGAGAELWRRERRRLIVRAEASNLTNRLNVINFAGLFSGTAIGPSRSGTVKVQVEF